MGFFDKIKKAFMNEKEAQPAEIETDETQTEAVEEDGVLEEQQVEQEVTEQAQDDSLEAIEAESETEIDPLITVNPVTQAEELVDPEIIEEQAEEIIVQDKYEKGLEKTRKTFGERLNELFANFRSVDEDFFEELEETLIGADVGFDTAIKITESLRQEVKLRNVKKPAAVQNTIIEKMVDLYEAEGIEENNALNIQPNGLTVMLFVGVNGVGKTTSIGKLAHEFKQDGKKVLMAAADTFRAGAIDQLVVWGERAGVEVVRGNAGGDPAAVVFDAVERAKTENADILLVDTAGRLQNKVNLMNELEKIKRVIQRELPDAPHEVLLVVDATTGQNAMSQAKQFKETTDVTGLVLTKLDGTAKGGIVLAIRNELHLPVKLVGLGEGIDDLEPFDANDFAIGLFKGLLKVED
ncbi:signal recognition particle-docking protein FtsY [Enterococcus haemoperoxidus ATCC BAA-382]|uniref:Signal recognition particle receptor FtsY n=1 Tax=Enterococcus haemoperoxidus ATCC BAA-382 TaxID=1158608 RepID=R2QKR3_9ENTE|nr:signal recognition particle-docking protein FtsY [Enterococcus haemoperoxidus]EOH97177.1 signal recognition particle-docking protein FtsY [Enterococcus haemoperoxidus ATCC BAA-382]EOT59990.1 signal recognition particle-docking protein FtsY [Enterococcus haemoperoxidus ATCC BAA-382]OJG56172.1 signal recognition particle-docking protein FtsY [Enterococcus haemoperoxidus]